MPRLNSARAGLLATLAGLALLSTPTFTTAAEDKPRRIEILVTDGGFVPARIEVKKGEKTALIFTRRTKKRCGRKVVVYLDDDETVTRDLPLDKPVSIIVTFPEARELGYTCGMGHKSGTILVR